MKTLVDTIKKSFRISSSQLIHLDGGIKMKLPATHLLPGRLLKHKMYDRFLPHIVADFHLSTIVDVGANIGDTVLSIFSMSKPDLVVCIEPSPYFFSYLLSNIQINTLHDYCLPVQATLSTPSDLCLFHDPNVSSASLSKQENGISTNSYSYVDLLSIAGLEECLIDLVKIDIDSYDLYVLKDIVDSFNAGLCGLPSLIYFEALLPAQDCISYVERLVACLTDLSKTRSHKYAIFSNTGIPIFYPCDLPAVSSALAYLSLKDSHCPSVTIPYFDILVYPEFQADRVEQSISSYFSKYAS
jgi:FkbM family methyltransferase